MASYQVSLQIARKKAAFGVGEKLIKPAAIDMVRQMCGKEQAAKLASVPLSNDSVQRRIMDMSLDVKEQVIKKIKDSGDFSVQLDETTDVAKCAQLLTYVRISGPDNLEEHFLFCKPLETTTKGIDIFNLVDSFFMDHGSDFQPGVRGPPSGPQITSRGPQGLKGSQGVRQSIESFIKNRAVY